MSKRFYVYMHRHPVSKDVVYVGKGNSGRAWSCGTSSGPSGKQGNRTKEHQEWIRELLDAGYTPADFVFIVFQGLDEDSARRLEAKLIEQYMEHFKLFNRMCYGTPTDALNIEMLNRAKELRATGKSYFNIAAEIGSTTMTVWRALNDKTKFYRESNRVI